MCMDSRASALLTGGLLLGLPGMAFAYSMDESRRAMKKQERAMENQAKAQKTLMAEYAEANRPTASKLTSGLSTRDRQRLLARSMGGTLLTDPMGAGIPAMGKKTLLGE